MAKLVFFCAFFLAYRVDHSRGRDGAVTSNVKLLKEVFTFSTADVVFQCFDPQCDECEFVRLQAMLIDSSAFFNGTCRSLSVLFQLSGSFEDFECSVDEGTREFVTESDM